MQNISEHTKTKPGKTCVGLATYQLRAFLSCCHSKDRQSSPSPLVTRGRGHLGFCPTSFQIVGDFGSTQRQLTRQRRGKSVSYALVEAGLDGGDGRRSLTFNLKGGHGKAFTKQRNLRHRLFISAPRKPLPRFRYPM